MRTFDLSFARVVHYSIECFLSTVFCLELRPLNLFDSRQGSLEFSFEIQESEHLANKLRPVLPVPVHCPFVAVVKPSLDIKLTPRLDDMRNVERAAVRNRLEPQRE